MDTASYHIEQIENDLCALEECRKAVKRLRDIFAHNLEGQHMAGDGKEIDSGNQEKIHDFFLVFGRFVRWIQEDRETVKALYKAEIEQKKYNVCRDKAMRLIIASADEHIDYQKYAEASSGKKYQVCTLDTEIMKYLDKNREKNLKDAVLFLVKYIQKLELDADMTHIVLYKLLPNQQINYMHMLKSIGFSHFYDEKLSNDAFPKLIFNMDEQRYKEISEDWDNRNEGNLRIQKLMDKDIIQI